jgi:acyl carrier protein phosphodiesterase
MNFLAHIYLSCNDEHRLIGNFLADFLNNKEVDSLPENLKAGVELHKSIDHFTDNHPSVKNAIQLLRPHQGKYAPVTVDILFDYILTLRWDQYSKESLRSVADKTYITLQKYFDSYPEKLQARISRMIEDDFLFACENMERLIRTFGMVAKRAQFDNSFLTAHVDYIQYEVELTTHFDTFFPDIIAFVNKHCDCE